MFSYDYVMYIVLTSLLVLKYNHNSIIMYTIIAADHDEMTSMYTCISGITLFERTVRGMHSYRTDLFDYDIGVES